MEHWAFAHLLNPALVLILAMLGSAAVARAVSPDRSAWQLEISQDSTNQVVISEEQELAVSGSVVHVVHTGWAQTNGDIKRLYYRRSTNGGESFEAPVVLEEHPGLEISVGRLQRLAVDGPNVHIVSVRAPIWSGGDWYYVIDYYRSTDAGATFEARRSVASGPAAHHLRMPHITAAGGQVALAYLFYPNWYTDSQLVILNSTDNGTTFSSKTIARSDKEAYDLWDLRRDGDHIALAFIATAGIPASFAYTYRIVVGASLDAGDSWVFNQVCSTNRDGWAMADSLSDYHDKPDLAWAGNTLYATWTGQDTHSIRQTFVARSLDGGRTFEPQVNLSEGQTASPQYGQASIAARGRYAYVIWNVPGTGIWLRHSTDGGASWSPARRLFGGWWPLVTIDPESADGSKVHFLSTPGLYRYSVDGGTTLMGAVNLTTVWSWWNNGVKDFQWGIGPGSVVHTAFRGVQYPMPSSDYDVYYRRLAPQAAPLQTNNQCLVLAGNHDELHYENMQIPSVPALQLTQALTLEMWVRPDAGCPADSTLLFQEQVDDYRGTMRLQTHNWNGRRPSGKIVTTNGLAEVWGGELMADGEWHHLALTFDAQGGKDNLRLYVDGRYSASVTAVGPIKASTEPIYIGGGAGSVYQTFRGAVDEVRLWNRALSETEIRVRTTSREWRDEPGLVAYYPLDGSPREATGQALDGVLMYREAFQPLSLAPRPVLRSASMTAGSLGRPFLHEFVADWATRFSVVDLPPGLVLDPHLGRITGTPTRAGAQDLRVTASNAFGAAEQKVRLLISDGVGVVFREDFNSGFAKDWSILRENAAGYRSLPGLLQLDCGWGDLWGRDNNAANLFLADLPTDGNFAATLLVSRSDLHRMNYAKVNLMAYNGEDDHVRAAYEYSGGFTCTLFRDIDGAMAVVGETPPRPVEAEFGTEPFLLRLVRRGSIAEMFWSTNGVDFVSTHVAGLPYDRASAKIGFYAGAGSDGGRVTLDALEVTTVLPPNFTNPVLAGGSVGLPVTFLVTSDWTPEFSAEGLPPGLSLRPDGTLVGTPGEAGIYETTLTARNAVGSSQQTLRWVVSPAAGRYFRDDFNPTWVQGWDALPADTNAFRLQDDGRLWLRANNGDTWQHYNRPLNLFSIAAPGTHDWVATLAVDVYEPTALNYNSLHLVAWDNTDNNVRLTYSHGDGRNVSITAENAQQMQSYGEARNFGATPFLLRLAKEGNQYRGSWSTNGVEFLPVSENLVTMGDGAPDKIGFWMGIDPSEANVAWLNYFEVTQPGNTTVAPSLTVTREEAGLRLSWSVASGGSDTLESSEDLRTWSGYSGPWAAPGNATNAVVPWTASPRFFRVNRH